MQAFSRLEAPGAGVSLIGNNAAAGFLRNALLGRSGAHAYLLTGPAGVGKRTLARWAAAALVCTSEREERPCGACRGCAQVSRDAHPDVLQLAPDEGHVRIRVRQVRAFEHDIALKPYEAERKVALVVGADRIEDEAANALLKTLEEPPAGTVLLLTATDAAQVMPTIASRCQEVALRPVPAEEIEQALGQRGAEGERAKLLARLVARLAGGRPGWAIKALDDASLLETRTQQLDMLESLVRSAPAARLAAVQSYTDSAAGRATALALLSTWLTWWRDALLVREGCEELVVNVDRLEGLRGLQISAAECWDAVRGIQDARGLLDGNANVRLVLESVLLGLPAGRAKAIR